mmetsp:Transcript_34638/g.74824  ORF Transcript_34638/g.74824 Transcript_34638/m.74824 type:complete len:468 (-) Transcript_34638:193-1596(-)
MPRIGEHEGRAYPAQGGGPLRFTDKHAQRSELEEEAHCLRQACEVSKNRLPQLAQELSEVEAEARAETLATEHAESTRRDLEAELERLRVVEGASEGARASLGQELHQELMSERSELEALRRSVEEGPQEDIRKAEETAERLKEEVIELRRSLEDAEHAGQKLKEEQRAAEEEVGPLDDWISHIDEQLNLARAEKAELTAALQELVHQRSALEMEELEAQPFQHAGMDAATICWLQDHEQKSISRKAVLEEEVAAERFRRQQFALEASRLRSEAAAEERRQDKRRQQQQQQQQRLQQQQQQQQQRQQRQQRAATAKGASPDSKASPVRPVEGQLRQMVGSLPISTPVHQPGYHPPPSGEKRRLIVPPSAARRNLPPNAHIPRPDVLPSPPAKHDLQSPQVDQVLRLPSYDGPSFASVERRSVAQDDDLSIAKPPVKVATRKPLKLTEHDHDASSGEEDQSYWASIGD